MRGTRKRPSSAAGAPARTTSRGRLGRATSGRMTLVIGTACVVGGTSSTAALPHLGDRVEHGGRAGRRRGRAPRRSPPAGPGARGARLLRDSGPSGTSVLMLGRDSTSAVLDGSVLGRGRDPATLRGAGRAAGPGRGSRRERLRSADRDRRRSARTSRTTPEEPCPISCAWWCPTAPASWARSPPRSATPASTSCPSTSLERGSGVAVDDVVVELPRDRLPDSLITAAAGRARRDRRVAAALRRAAGHPPRAGAARGAGPRRRRARRRSCWPPSCRGSSTAAGRSSWTARAGSAGTWSRRLGRGPDVRGRGPAVDAAARRPGCCPARTTGCPSAGGTWPSR